jgi:hypothetical protein
MRALEHHSIMLQQLLRTNTSGRPGSTARRILPPHHGAVDQEGGTEHNASLVRPNRAVCSTAVSS